MADNEAKIKEIENEIAMTQKNKATEGHLAVLKSKLAKLRREQLTPSSSGGGKGRGFDVTKVGHARIGLVGFPSVGKSTLLNKLTDTYSTVADYAFTTLEAVPGVIKYNGARIQLLDLPGIIEGAKDGKGRGKQVIGTARTCDLMMVVLDSGKPITHKQHIEKELEGFGIRLNKEPPNISFKRKEKGGINYTYSVTDPKNCPSLATVQQICKEYKVPNADIVMKGDYSEEDLIDVLEGNRVYMLCIYAMNKIDNLTLEELEILDSLPHYVPISSEREWNLDGLLEKMWDYLNFNRIYPKPKGSDPDFEEPVCLQKKKSTVADFCAHIHKDLLKSFSHALVWGLSTKHSPQRVGRDHQLEDEDVLQIVKKG